MKRIIASVLMTSIFLCGCSNESIIHTNYTELLKKDLQVLADGPWDSDPNSQDYTIEFSHSLTSNELGHVYTIDIGYKNKYIDDIYVIVLPGSYLSNPLDHNVPHVGYTQRINLAESKNLENNDRENIRLQIELVDNEENIYVSVKYDDNLNLFKF